MAVNWSKYGYEEEENKKEPSVTRVNWEKYEPVSAEQFSSHMNSMPDLFNPSKQQAAVKERFAPEPVPQATSLPSPSELLRQQNEEGRFSAPVRAKERAATVKHNAPTLLEQALTAGKEAIVDPLSRTLFGDQQGGRHMMESPAREFISKFQPDPIFPNNNLGKFATGLTSGGIGLERLLGRDEQARMVDSKPGQYGQIAQSLLPGAMAERLVAPVLKNAPTVLNIAGRGVAGGIGDSLAVSAQNARTPQEVAENLAWGAGGGAAGGLLLGGALRGATALRDTVRNAAEGVLGKNIGITKAIEAAGRDIPGKFRVGSQEDFLSKVIRDISPEVSQRITPPMENPRELARWLQPHTGASLNEIRKLSYDEMAELAQDVQRNLDVYDIEKQVASGRGYDLDNILNNTQPEFKELVMSRLGRTAEPAPSAVVEAPVQNTTSVQSTVVNNQPNMPKANQPEVENISPQRENVPAPIREAEEIVKEVNQPRVRDKVYSYLDDAEKAARDRISKRKNRLSANPIDEWADHAIVMAAKLGKGTIKAADFAEVLVKEFGEQVRPHAARIFRQSQAILKNQGSKVKKSIEEADVFNNSGKGDASTFDTKISRDAKKKTSTWQQKFDKVRSQFVDDLAQLERLEKNVTGSVASAEDSLYKTARMYKGVPERAAQIVTDRLSPIIKGIENAGYSADDLGRYALARHAQDVNAAGYKSGFTNAEIKDVLEKFGTPEMMKAQQDLVKINRDMLQELVDNGVVSEQLSKVLNERWKNYIPLFRSFDDDKVEFTGGLSKALANVSDPIVALKGSERAVVDPLENMVKNIMQSVNSAERNKVATQLSKLAAKDTDGQFIRKLDPNEKSGRKNVVTVRENGEAVKYEVEPEVYKTFLNMDQESSNMLVNILSKPASLLRAGATLTPEFSLRNPMRDVLQAFVTSESGFTPLDFAAGLIQTIKRGDMYKDWIDNLGAYGNVMSQDRNVHRQALEKVLKEPPGKKFVNIVNPKSWLNVLRTISDTTESATKVGEYRAALRSGATKQEAAYRSRDLMDFARSGSSIRQTNRMVAFLNANIQGKSKLIRSIKANPVGTISRMVAATTVPTVGIFVINKQFANDTQKQTIAEAPDWQKDAFWLVAIPGTDMVARIPKPFDIAPIFANLPERALDYVYNNDKKAFDGFARRVLGDSALPMQLSGLLPFIEGMADYSFFREGSIIPQRESGLQPRDQYDPIRTTETAKLLARGAEELTGGKGPFKNFASPRIMDNTIKGLTAGLGTYATSAIDSVLQGNYFGAKLHKPVIDRPEAPSKRTEQRPLAKAFLVDPLQGGKSMDKFYEEKEKLSSEKASAEINQRPFTKSGRLDQLNAASETISKINKRVREIEKSDMTPKEKRAQIDTLVKQRNTITQNVMKAAR
ncbi:LPD38 domain-containing protein [Paenibacillus agaridevorans]|uniref:LPD38 domain-containing protein n=1 Tax=Paenibacillus agaridevorans TaxID=171404 RepID=UPI001BE46974|nr:LPD38 domain-containing protein [Paenibacillus agaridevorans]